jgi:GxxExxY protein
MLVAPPEIEQLAHRVIGAAIEVHKHLGPGFIERAYEDAIAIELAIQGIPFRRQVEIDIQYKGYAIATSRLDLLIDNMLIVELKAIDGIGPLHVKQTLSYLAACGLELGLILNFNVPSMNERGIRRVFRSIYPE